MSILSKSSLASLFFLSFIGLPHVLHSQCDTSQVADWYAKPKGGGTDSIPSSKFLPGFGYEMHSDSGFTMYKVGDFKKNGNQIWLHGWCDTKDIRDLNSSQLADSTRTTVFTINTGDSITLYRELAWFNPITIYQSPNNYYAFDTLDYAIELVNSSTGARLALLDSIGVLRQIPSGAPTIYGTQPIIAIVNYIVPSQHNNKNVFIRIKPYARGTGPYDFVRTDRWGMALSDRVNETEWQSYLSYMGGSSSKTTTRVVEENSDNITMMVTPNPSSGEVEITFDCPENDQVSVGTFDLLGNRLFIPFYTPRGNGLSHSAKMFFDKSGTYIIALYYNNNLVKTAQVTITK